MEKSPLTEEDVKRIYRDTSPVTRSEFKRAFEALKAAITLAVSDLRTLIDDKIAALDRREAASEARIDKRLSEIKNGKDGINIDHEKAVKDVLAQIRQPKDGETPAVDHQQIATMAAALIPPPKDADVLEAVRLTLPQVLKEIDKRVPLLGDALKATLETHVKELVAKTAYGPGGGTSFSIQQSGTQKVQQPFALNFKGAGAPTITVGQNGVTNLDFPTGGGGGGTGYQAPLSGGITGTNTWTTAPSIIVVDQGKAMQKTNTDGTVNWTGTTTTVLSVTPVFDVYAAG